MALSNQKVNCKKWEPVKYSLITMDLMFFISFSHYINKLGYPEVPQVSFIVRIHMKTCNPDLE